MYPVPGFNSLALWFNDLKLKTQYQLAPSAIDERIIVVEVDEPSINQIGRWPWDRSVFAKLIDGLREASVVGLDMVFSEASNRDQDQALADSIRQANNVVLGYFFQDASTQKVSQIEDASLDECSLYNVELVSETVSLPEFPHAESNIATIHNSAISCGYFSIHPDSDGLYRRYLLTAVHKGLVLPSFALQMLRFYQNAEPELVIGKETDFLLTTANQQFSNYRMRLSFASGIQRISASKIVSGEVPANTFKDKLVIVGVTETGLFDMRPTPVDAAMPGVYIHAAALNDLLNGSELKNNTTLEFVLLGLVILVCLLAYRMRRLEIRVPCYVLAVGVILALSYSLVLNKIWIQELQILFALVLLSSFNEISLFRKANRNAEYLKSAFSAYVSDQLVKQIIKDPDALTLGGKEKTISVLFSDIRNFTSLSETLSPSELIAVLNEFFDPLTQVALSHDGMLDKYIGDAMMVIYNAPVDVDNHAHKACISALEMVSLTGTLNEKIAHRVSTRIEIGIGVNTGNAVVGNVGSSKRFSYTALGDSVNTASRLEGLTKQYGVKIILSEHTFNELRDTELFFLRHLDRVRVKGKKEAINIYELDWQESRSDTLKVRYEAALGRYFSGEFKEAQGLFADLSKEFQDRASQVLADRCKVLCLQPPPRWDGAAALEK